MVGREVLHAFDHHVLGGGFAVAAVAGDVGEHGGADLGFAQLGLDFGGDHHLGGRCRRRRRRLLKEDFSANLERSGRDQHAMSEVDHPY